MVHETPSVRVSLLPEQGDISSEAEVRRRYQVLALTIVIALAVSFAGAAMVYLVARGRSVTIAAEKAKLAKVETLVAAEEARLKDFSGVVKILQAAPAHLDAHIDPVPLFAELEKKTIATVSYKTISLRADEVTVEVLAPDYPTAARQVRALEESSALFAKVVAPSFRGTEKLKEGEDEVIFHITLTLKPGVLKFK